MPRPHRPAKPGQISSTPQHSGKSGRSGNGGGLGAAIAGYPDVNNGQQDTPDTEGPDSGSGEGTIGPSSPVISKPSFLQSWLNPALGQGYANYLYNINPSNQAAMARQQLEGQQNINKVKEEGTQNRLTGSAATDNAIREAQNKHVIDVASQFNIPAERVPEFQAAMYPGAKSTALAQQGTQQNIAGAQQQATSTPKYANSVGIGMNANAQMDAGKLANLTKMDVGPGQTANMYPDFQSAPFSLKGPTSTSNTSAVTTRGPASSQYPNGIPMGGSATITGQQFGGGSSSMPSLGDTSGGDAYSDYLDAIGGNNPTPTPQPAHQQGQSSPIATKPPINPLPRGSLGNSGGISNLLQWLMSKGGNGGQFTPPSGAGY